MQTLICLLSDISAAKLSLGSSMEISHVKRGDDIYLECGVQANPRPHKVIWEKDVSILFEIKWKLTLLHS